MKVSSKRSEFKFFFLIVIAVVYCLKIIGLAPFSVQTKYFSNRSSCNNTKVFSFSKNGLAYSILLLVLVPITAGLLSHHLFSLNYQHESSVTRAIDRSDGILCVFTAWIIITAWTFNQRKAACIMNRIFEMDVKLSGRNQQSLNKMTFVFITTHVMINVSLWVTILIMESMQPVISDAFANWFFLILPSLIIYCFTIEYLLVVGLVRRRLDTVNKNLSKFNEFRYYLHRPLFLNAYPAGWSLSSHSCLEALNLLHNIRTEIFEICHEIAEFFSFPILACVAYSFFSLIINTYYIISVCVLENGNFSIGGVSSAVAWASLSVYPLGLLFFNVTRTVMEAKLTGRLVHKLLSSAMREEIKEELELFSLQLLHENLDFTAYGFFKLDFTLLHSMLGATATYLVILIQFQK